jgi:hypothetical protein
LALPFPRKKGAVIGGLKDLDYFGRRNLHLRHHSNELEKRMKIKNAVVTIALAMALGLLISNPLTAAEGKEQSGAQSLCPVMNLKINKDLYVDVEGKRIYVCCAHCIDKIKSDPAEYIDKMTQQGVTLEKTP